MKCKNCERPFGINLDYDVFNEPNGQCIICEIQLCEICAYAPRIETREVIDPEQYSISRFLLCGSCMGRVGTYIASAA